MMKKVVVAALFLFMAIVPLTGYAAGNDNASPPPAGDQSSPAGKRSYFEGVWVGSWPGYKSTGFQQDVTITIDRGGKEGVFLVEYSWGFAPSGSGFNPIPGSKKGKGREEGDQFVFGWKDMEGRDLQITLKKHEDNKVKARLDKSGPLKSKERPYNETYLNRK